ncbi:unnamed protein product, partial [Polarella glacialis]
DANPVVPGSPAAITQLSEARAKLAAVAAQSAAAIEATSPQGFLQATYADADADADGLFAGLTLSAAVEGGDAEVVAPRI